MGFIDTAKAITGAAGAIMSGLDGLFTSDAERNEARLILDAGLNQAFGDVLEHANRQEVERTARHALDMNSDSWLSKNIRPIVLVVITTLFIFLVVLDSMPASMVNQVDGGILVQAAKFAVKERWIDLLETLLVAVYGFYFVSRGIQASMQSYTKMKNATQPELK